MDFPSGRCVWHRLAVHTYDPARGFPRIMPSLRYRDVEAAIDWLTGAFGFTEHLRWVDREGVVRHAEMRLEDGFVELSDGGEGYGGPKRLGESWGALVVLVDDVDAHHERAQAAGAVIISEPEDKPWGLRQYTAEDPEGPRWEFSEFVRDVPPAEWGARLAG